MDEHLWELSEFIKVGGYVLWNVTSVLFLSLGQNMLALFVERNGYNNYGNKRNHAAQASAINH